MVTCLDVFARVKINFIPEEQKILEQHFTLAEKIRLCHLRIPEKRHVEGFLDTGLIAPLPIWSPVPEKYQKTAQDRFSIVGLEAQQPKYLPEILKPFVHVKKRGKTVFLTLSKGAYKNG